MIGVTPAYGRDYATGRKARAAWRRGEDFIQAGAPISIRDCPGIDVVGIYDHGTRRVLLQRATDPVDTCPVCGRVHAVGRGHAGPLDP